MSLNVSSCKHITNDGVQALGLGGLPLRVLDLSNSAALTDEGAKALTRLKGLRYLSLAKCPGISETYICFWPPVLQLFALALTSFVATGPPTGSC